MHREIVTEPFRHRVWNCGWPINFTSDEDDLWTPPPPEWDGWEVVYRDDVQNGKRTARKFDRLTDSHRFLFRWLIQRTHIESRHFDIPGLEPDPTLHGGGLHVMPPGSRLNGHVDYALHPHLPGKERRLSVIVFLNSEWQESWGGALCLLGPLGNVVKRIYPAPGRVVAFENSDISYHAVETVTGPVDRVTAAVYFLSNARPGVTRQRALFFPTREDS